MIMNKLLKGILYREMATMNGLNDLFHLLEELTEVTDEFLLWLINYCEDNNIPLWKEKQLKNYIKISKKSWEKFKGE